MAVASAFLAVAGHIAGGAPAPGTDAVLLVLLFLVPACWAVMSGQRRTMTLAALSATVQAFAHLVFALSCVSGAAPTLLDSRMIAAHATATVAMAWLLASGDAVIWLLFRFAVQHLAALSALAGERIPMPARLVVIACNAGTSLVTQWRHCGASRRGPPECLLPA